MIDYSTTYINPTASQNLQPQITPTASNTMSGTDSSLSDAPSDLEDQIQLKKGKSGILQFFKPPTKKPPKPVSPPPPKRSMTPPREPVLADNEHIAFIVMFRSRFNEAFPKSLANFGPQDIERGVVDSLPSEPVEDLLCALLGLLLNRKQDVKRGHYNRALEEAIQTHKSQWPKEWAHTNPLLGSTTFTSMMSTQRLTLLRTLILWSLSSSETVKGMITASYKQARHDDDLNQPLSVQPWGQDGHKRRYYLIEGRDDTSWRVYRESGTGSLKRTWLNVAGDLEEIKALAEKLAIDDGTKHAKVLSNKMLAAIPLFEAKEEKRKRREYRQQRKQQFRRPVETGFLLYEGRTRGKKMRYTFSEDEDNYTDENTNRRSMRNTRNHTPAEPTGPTITQSGRHVKTRQGGLYGETITSIGGDGAFEEGEEEEDAIASRRPRRAAAASAINGNGKRVCRGYNSVDDMEDEYEDDISEQDYGDEEEVPVESDVDEPISEEEDEDKDMQDAVAVEEGTDSMIVKLNIKTSTPERKPSGIRLKLSVSAPSKQIADNNMANLIVPTLNATNGFSPQPISVSNSDGGQ